MDDLSSSLIPSLSLPPLTPQPSPSPSNIQISDDELLADVDNDEVDTMPDESFESVKKYVKESETGVATCIICHLKFTKPKMGNVRRHLSRAHSGIYKRIKEQEDAVIEAKKAKVGKQDSSQQQLRFPNDGKRVNVNAAQQAKRMLTRYVARSSLPLSHVDQPDFKGLLELIPGFKCPSRREVQRWIGSYFDEGVSIMRAVMLNQNEVNCFSIAADIAVSRGMSYSYLAVTSHFFSQTRKELVVMLLDVIHLTERHTAQYIRDCVEKTLKDYGSSLADKRLLRCVIDNGANMVAAFRDPFVYRVDEEERDVSATDDLVVPPGSLVSVEFNREEAPFEDFNIGYCDEEERLYEEFQVVFQKHVCCSAHTLQLVQKEFVLSVPEIDYCRKVAFEILNKFSHSALATQQLIKMTGGRKLLFPGATRFSSIQIALQRLSDVVDEVNAVCVKQKWKTLDDHNLEVMRDVLDMLKPLQDFTTRLQCESVPTISLLQPGLHHLCKAIEIVGERKSVTMKAASQVLISILRRRFQFVFDSGNIDADPLYLSTAVVDRSVSWTLTATDRENAERALFTTMQLYMGLNLLPQPQAAELRQESHLVDNPFGFQAPHLQENIATASRSASTPQTPFHSEVAHYVRNTSLLRPSSAECQNPLFYWINNKQAFPQLSQLAIALLCIPGTSASVERCFSILTNATSGHKSRTAPDLVKKKMMITFNSKYFL